MKNNINTNTAGTINTIIRQVEFYYDETDTFTELYRNVNYKKDGSQGDKYYARCYYGMPVWYSVCGVDDGYCELNCEIKNNVVFEIVSENDKNTVLLTQGNGIDYKYPSWKTWVKETLKSIISSDNKVLSNVTEFYNKDVAFWSGLNGAEYSKVKFNQWLLSYKDKNIVGKVADDYAENWLNFYQCVGMEKLSKSYKNLLRDNEEIALFKVHNKHQYCNVEWYEYWLGYVNRDGLADSLSTFIGYEYDNTKIGTVYSKSITKDIENKIIEALKLKPETSSTNMFINKYYLYYIDTDYSTVQRIEVSSLVRRLNNLLFCGSYDRKAVDRFMSHTDIKIRLELATAFNKVFYSKAEMLDKISSMNETLTNYCCY